MNVRRTAAIAALTLSGLAIGTGIAAAHVRVSADTTAPGAYSVLTFKVPTESATASTTEITITLPTATPLQSVSFQQLPGWTAEAVTEKLAAPVVVGDDTITEAVSSVTYTAQQGGGIPPGGFAFFALSVGPLPQTSTLTFPVDQKYSDGTVVSWADPQPAGAAEPEHPAPTLTLGAAAGATTDGHGATVTAASDATALVEANTDTTARVTAIAALVIAAFSVLMGAIALRRPAAVAASTALAAESAPQPPASNPARPATGTKPAPKKRNR